MTYEEKKKEFELFCAKKRWNSNIPYYASEFFGVSVAAIKKWQGANGKIPDSAINLMFSEYKVLELQEKLVNKENELSEVKRTVRAYFKYQEELKELSKI